MSREPRTRIPIERIQKRRVGGRLGASYRRQTHPQHRHPLGLEYADHLVDLFSVEFDPAFLAELMQAARRARALLRPGDRSCAIAIGGIVWRQFGIRHFGCAIRLRRGFFAGRLAIGFGLGVLLVPRLVVGFIGCRLADCGAVIKPEHDDNGVRFFGGENAFGSGGPIDRIALRLILDQAGGCLVFADHTHVRLIGIDFLKPISEPVRHGVTEHKNVALRYSAAFLRRRRL